MNFQCKSLCYKTSKKMKIEPDFEPSAIQTAYRFTFCSLVQPWFGRAQRPTALGNEGTRPTACAIYLGNEGVSGHRLHLGLRTYSLVGYVPRSGYSSWHTYLMTCLTCVYVHMPAGVCFANPL